MTNNFKNYQKKKKKKDKNNICYYCRTRQTAVLKDSTDLHVISATQHTNACTNSTRTQRPLI